MSDEEGTPVAEEVVEEVAEMNVRVDMHVRRDENDYPNKTITGDL